MLLEVEPRICILRLSIATELSIQSTQNDKDSSAFLGLTGKPNDWNFLSEPQTLALDKPQ